MTRRAGGAADSDANMRALLDAGAPVATIVGKSWDFHVTEALGTTLAEDLAMIGDTIAFLPPRMDEVIFDAESVVPSLILKMGLDCIPEPNLRELRDVSRFVSELANRKPWSSQPYVGDSAFAHKGGMHVSAVLKHPETYEHIDPQAVGNHRRVLVSELAGKSNILWKAREYGIDIDRDTPDPRRILDQLKALEDH